jgi:hypothetical protein
MTESPDTAETQTFPADTPARTGKPDTGQDTAPTAAVIARPSQNHWRWEGRYLHHAPGPSSTARLLRDVITLRSTTRSRVGTARRELIDQHPAGWAHLGSATGKDPEVKARRRPAPAGSCYCHDTDESPTPALIEHLLATVNRIEVKADLYHTAVEKLLPTPAGPTDGTPWLMRPGSSLPAHVAWAFIMREDGITVAARDGAGLGGFLRAGQVPWSGPADWEQIDQNAAAIRARTPVDLARAEAADDLDAAARRLAEYLPDSGLAMRLLDHAGRYRRTPIEHTAQAALARTAEVDLLDLARHVSSLDLPAQADLLKAAAAQARPTGYPSV